MGNSAAIVVLTDIVCLSMNPIITPCAQTHKGGAIGLSVLPSVGLFVCLHSNDQFEQSRFCFLETTS